jgi:hypothetical protein
MDLEQTLMRWGEAGAAAGAIIGGVPGAVVAAFDERRVELTANGEPLATLRAGAQGELVAECELSYEIRESVMAAGLAQFLPDGEVAVWRIPPEPVDLPIVLLRVKAASL